MVSYVQQIPIFYKKNFFLINKVVLGKSLSSLHHLVVTLYICVSNLFKNCQVHEKVKQIIANQRPGYHKWHLRQVAQTSAKLTSGQSNPGETKTKEATAPELGPVSFWSPTPSSFSGSDSIVVEEAARNFLSPRPRINKSGAPNFFIQHDKVEDSKLRRYLETCGRALEQFLQRQTSSNDSIIFLLRMPLDQLVRGRTSLRERAQ